MSGPETLPALPSQRRLNPLVGAAAVALVVASLTVVAAVTGVLPITKATQAPAEASYSSYSGASGGSYSGNQTGTQPVVNEPPPLTSQPAPGSTTRPPAYDARQAQNNMAPPPAQPVQQAQAEEKPAARPSHTAGHVTGVQVVEAEKPTSGLGAVGGAVVGGLLGNQIGSGNGRILGTVAGAAAGGFGGNYAEKKLNTNKSYRVSVKMDDGSRRTFTYQNPPGVEVGQRVHLERGVLVTG
ncbi:Outer membrane lipoprotein [Cupriavidus sp. U2]|uniref:glycine zipper 2TM domain-containing protein n=1 Tax=Cupriavidus sp. U2 TaxID=2920269 RepID=UPI00129EBD09|nr:glycine zipper 2TM domain-containing protein [Cupriavidus sp. U2]KAI3590180.1 Outer membrane lipoprotein [Cupriavidus sp. U2]